MGNIVSNRWLDALIKTVIFLIVVHIILWIIGMFMGTGAGVGGLNFLWPHWTTGGGNTIISIIILIVIYFIVYYFFTGK